MAAFTLRPSPQGLYCEAGDFFVDPMRPVARAVITHGHADHARAGHGSVLATRETLAIMAVRYGEQFAAQTQAAAYGETVSVNGVNVRLVPAGHVLGSAQAVIEHGGVRVVVSGDYKRRRDPTCPAFEPVPCDTFISEATFGLPVFVHPPDKEEIAKLIASLSTFPDRTHLVGAYSLGKAQRVIALLREAGWDAPVYLHGAMTKLCDLYAALGVMLGDLRPVAGEAKEAFAGAVVLAPPSAINDRWAQRFGDPVRAFASGWMRIRARARQAGVELPLILSDHADWEELTATVHDVSPGALWVTHGQEDALLRWSELNGVTARALRLVGYGDDGEPEAA
jgi:putative mRNA 3-end processing factor